MPCLAMMNTLSAKTSLTICRSSNKYAPVLVGGTSIDILAFSTGGKTSLVDESFDSVLVCSNFLSALQDTTPVCILNRDQEKFMFIEWEHILMACEGDHSQFRFNSISLDIPHMGVARSQACTNKNKKCNMIECFELCFGTGSVWFENGVFQMLPSSENPSLPPPPPCQPHYQPESPLPDLGRNVLVPPAAKRTMKKKRSREKSSESKMSVKPPRKFFKIIGDVKETDELLVVLVNTRTGEAHVMEPQPVLGFSDCYSPFESTSPPNF